MSSEKIKWHEECANNSQNYYEKRINDLIVLFENEINYFSKGLLDTLFYKLQIETAKKAKKDGFDRERYLKKDKNCKKTLVSRYVECKLEDMVKRIKEKLNEE